MIDAKRLLGSDHPAVSAEREENKVRRLFMMADSGLTSDALRWGVTTGRWVRVQRNVYADGPEPPTQLDRERAKVLASGSPARGQGCSSSSTASITKANPSMTLVVRLQ